jgi:hypothetical protein
MTHAAAKTAVYACHLDEVATSAVAVVDGTSYRGREPTVVAI